MSLSVKAYLRLSSGEGEIRRFSVPQDVASSFAYLVEKIQRVFPQLLRQKFTVAWKDSDDEKVTFSSDEELTEALSNLKGEFFRVYIDGPIDETKPKRHRANEPAHPGVICDGCDENIKGTRFKCVVCPDYDLCSSCEDQGTHPDHEMLRIRVPRTGPYHGPFRGGRGRGFGCGGARAKGSRRHCGRGPFAYGFTFPSQQHSNEAPGPSTANNTEQPDFNQVMKAVADMMSSLFNNQQADQSEGTTDNQNPGAQTSQSKDSNTPSGAEQAEPLPTQNESQSPDFVMVDKTENKEQKQHPEPERQQYKPLSNEEILQLRLNEATSQLVQMGFTNEGGWLTTLLKEKDCDIGKVLDMLSIAGKQ